MTENGTVQDPRNFVLTRTAHDARDFIITVIEAGDASRDDFDVDAICDELRSVAGGWDFTDVEEDTFWAVIAKWHRESVEKSRCDFYHDENGNHL